MKHCKILLLTVTILVSLACMTLHAQSTESSKNTGKTLKPPTSTITNGNYDVTVLGSTQFRNDGYFVQLTLFTDQKRFATSNYNIVRIWDIESGRELAFFESEERVSNFAISDNCQYLVSIWFSKDNGNAYIDYWDLSTKKLIRTINCKDFNINEYTRQHIYISPDGLTLAFATDDGTRIVLYDLSSKASYIYLDVPEVEPLYLVPSMLMVYILEILIGLFILEFILAAIIRLRGGTRKKRIRRLIIGTCVIVAILLISATGYGIWLQKNIKLPFFAGMGPEMLAFSPDSKTLATLEWSVNTTLWDVKTGAIKQRYGMTGMQVEFSNDGQKLGIVNSSYTKGKFGTTTFDLKTNERTFTPYPLGDDEFMISFSRNFNYGLAYNRTTDIWTKYDLETLKPIVTLPKSLSSISQCISNDGSFIITNNRASRSTITIWSTTNKFTRQAKGHKAQITDIIFSPDNNTIHSTSMDGTVRHWDLKSNTQQINEIPNPQKLSHDGALVTSRKANHISNTQTGKTIAKIKTSRHSTAFSPDNRLLVTPRQKTPQKTKNTTESPSTVKPSSKTSSSNYFIDVWDIATTTKLVSFNSHSTTIAFIDFMPDDEHIISIDRGGKLYIWNINTLNIKTELTLAMTITDEATLSQDGKLLVASGYNQIKIPSSKISAKKSKKGYQKKNYRKEPIFCIIDLQTKNQQNILKSHWQFSTSYGSKSNPTIKDMEIFPDNKTMIISLADRTLRIIDLETGNITKTIHNRITDDPSTAGAIVNKIAITADGKTFATGNFNGTINIYHKRP